MAESAPHPDAQNQEDNGEQLTGEHPTIEETEAPKAPALYSLVLRDVALVFAVLTLWGAGDAWSFTSGLAIAGFVALGNAIFIGLLLGALFHEWGHYVGAKLSGAATRLVQPETLLSLFRFRFDFDENDRRQFHWMTWGGHAGQWGVLLALLILIPMDTANRVGLASAIFAFGVYASVIEIPIILDSRSGTDPQEALRNGISREIYVRAGVIGAVSGLFLFALIT